MPFSAARLARKPFTSMSLKGIQPVHTDQAIVYSRPVAGLASVPEPAALAAAPEPATTSAPVATDEPAAGVADAEAPEPVAALSAFLPPHANSVPSRRQATTKRAGRSE